MKYSELKKNKWFKVLTNKFVFVGLVFLIWMLFLDANSWLNHRELNQEKNELLDNKAFYLKEIQKDKATLQILQDSVEIERFARETYFMKRANEEIFIIEFEDSLKTK